MRSRAAKMTIVALGAALAAAGCAALAGLPDYALGAGDGGVADAGDAATREVSVPEVGADTGDAACARTCPAAYACVAGGCGNDVVQVVAGSDHACVRLRGGEVWCWGDNGYGQLGVAYAGDGGSPVPPCATQDCRPHPVKVPLPLRATWISAGLAETCAVDTAGAVYCWGLNNAGQLGHTAALGDALCSGSPCNGTPGQVAFTNGKKAKTVSVGGAFVCALMEDTTVSCWGENTYGTLGTPSYVQGSPVPLQVVNIDAGVVEVSAGLEVACALKGDGTVWCWGDSDFGAAGHDPAPDPPCVENDAAKCSLPAEVLDRNGNPINHAAKVSAGDFGACFLSFTSDATIWCWGSNVYGQLGTGTLVNNLGHTYPVAQSAPNQASVSGLLTTRCATSQDGGVSCWGHSVDLSLGEAGAALAQTCGLYPCLSYPVAIPGLSDITQVATGGSFGVALRSDGVLLAWGSNLSGTLGHAPGPDAGDQLCTVAGVSDPCNATPSRVTGLP